MAEAIDELARQQKPNNHGRVVASLEFSFWTRLFGGPYRRGFLPLIVSGIFPNAAPRQRAFGQLAERLNKLRMYRNRVYHYEPIWHQHPERTHAYIVESINWMNLEALQTLALIDRFESVFQSGLPTYRTKVEGLVAPLGERDE